MRFNKNSRKKIYKKLLNKYGLNFQLNMLMEECAELIQATNKYIRYNKESAQPIRNLSEEIADVEIMIEQIKYHLDLQDLELRIETEKHDKLLKLKVKCE